MGVAPRKPEWTLQEVGAVKSALRGMGWQAPTLQLRTAAPGPVVAVEDPDGSFPPPVKGRMQSDSATVSSVSRPGALSPSPSLTPSSTSNPALGSEPRSSEPQGWFHGGTVWERAPREGTGAPSWKRHQAGTSSTWCSSVTRPCWDLVSVSLSRVLILKPSASPVWLP